MAKADLALIRRILENQLKEAVSATSPSEAIHIHQSADPLDMTREASDRDVAVMILNRESALVRHLRSAIVRIEDGSYGICVECEEEIAPGRLKAIPWAELCIRCQESAEKRASEKEGSAAVENYRRAA
jgi:DnaK suppressor protein